MARGDRDPGVSNLGKRTHSRMTFADYLLFLIETDNARETRSARETRATPASAI